MLKDLRRLVRDLAKSALIVDQEQFQEFVKKFESYDDLKAFHDKMEPLAYKIDFL